MKTLADRATGADLALLFFASHGLALEEGNVLTPIDAKVDCSTGAVTQGVLVEQFMRGWHPTISLRKPCCASQEFWSPDFRNGSRSDVADCGE